MKYLATSLSAVLLGAATLASAQDAPTPPPVPCSAPEYRQFDFWVGEWDLSWDNGDGTTSKGRNIISRTPYGDCIIRENFDGTPSIPLKGMSVSTYSVPAGQWRQTWVDNQGSYLALSGGPQADGTFVLLVDQTRPDVPQSRMVFKNITEDSLVWHWQGRPDATAVWADQWVIRYTRR